MSLPITARRLTKRSNFDKRPRWVIISPGIPMVTIEAGTLPDHSGYDEAAAQATVTLIVNALNAARGTHHGQVV